MSLADRNDDDEKPVKRPPVRRSREFGRPIIPAPAKRCPTLGESEPKGDCSGIGKGAAPGGSDIPWNAGEGEV